MLQIGPAEGLFSCKSDLFHSYHLNFKGNDQEVMLRVMKDESP